MDISSSPKSFPPAAIVSFMMHTSTEAVATEVHVVVDSPHWSIVDAKLKLMLIGVLNRYI
jgi:hypothetical protein